MNAERDRLRGMYREAADWIATVQIRYGLGPEASPEDVFMVASEQVDEIVDERVQTLIRAARNTVNLAKCYCNDPFPIADKHQPQCPVWIVDDLRSALESA